MADKKSRFLTPACPCRYPWLQTPDTKFKPLGEYRVDLIMEPDKAKAMLLEVQGLVIEQAEAIRRDPKYNNYKLAWPVKDEVDDDTGQPTGKKIVTFKQNAAVVRGDGKKDVYAVHLFDARREPFPETVMIGSGSTIRISFRVRAVASPVSKDIRVMLHPLAVQIITLVEYKPDFGFSDEEGYIGAEAATTTAASGATSKAPSDPFPDGTPGIPEDDIPF